MLANARSFPVPAAQWSRYEAEREEDTHRECEIQEKGSSLFPLVPCSCGVSRDAAHFGARLRLSKGRADLPGFSSLANVRVALRHAPPDGGVPTRQSRRVNAQARPMQNHAVNREAWRASRGSQSSSEGWGRRPCHEGKELG